MILFLAAVAVLTTIWYRRRPNADAAGAEGAGLLFASGLTAAHLYYYDETVFLLPNPAHAHVSSSLVRQVSSLGGDVSPYVPAAVANYLQERVE